MQVGDLIKPKSEGFFKRMGHAIITYHDGGNVTFTWINNKKKVSMRWWQLEEWMVLA